MKKIFYILFFIPVLIFSYNFEYNYRDSLFVKQDNADSLISTAVKDTLTSIDSLNTDDDIDAVIIATASDSLTFDVTNKKMFLYGSGVITYKDSELKSGLIDISFSSNDVNAKGRIDTTDGNNKLIETPSLREGTEIYEGERLKYNFKSKRGFISHAKNKMTDVRYEGEKVKKIDKDTYFIEDGIYTTCNSDTPHTHFSAQQMKLVNKDKIIAKWIFMYIGGVPLPIPIPFAVFPTESGRRSGIIIPAYGTTADKGQFFRNFGYFFAINDYVDLALAGDYYTRGGYGLRTRSRYSKRYNYSGAVSGGFSNIQIGEDIDPDKVIIKDWQINLYHQQTIDPTMNLNVYLQYMSSSYYQNNSFNTNDLLQQDIVSNATFNKRWEESGNSLTLNYNRTQSLSTGNITEELPNLLFNKNFAYPFRDEEASERNLKWYEYFGYQYDGRFLNKRNKTNGQLKVRGGIVHNLSFSASPKLGYFNVSPRVNYTEKWYNKRTSKELIDKKIVTNDVKEINIVRTFDLGLSAYTKIYGMMPINNLGIDAFRHTVTPSLSYNYAPDFSGDFWGYYETVIDSSGNIIKYDKYQNEVFGGASSTERQAISFSIGNIFELKTLKDLNDTTSQAKKFTLMNVNAGLSYNFAADSLRLSDLYIGYRTQIGDYLNFNATTNYTFYEYENNKSINKFLINQGKGLMRLTNLSLSLSTNLTGSKLFGDDKKAEEKTESEVDELALKQGDYIALYDEQPVDFSIPWTLRLDFNYLLNKRNPDQITESMNVGLNASLNISEKWKIILRGNYDFDRNEISAPQINISRDLHCWEMNFTWNPLGSFRGFSFEIRMKAPELKDIKVTKSKGLYSDRR